MPGTVLSMQNIYLVKKNYTNPPEGDTKPPEDSASMKFVYHQLNQNKNLSISQSQKESSVVLKKSNKVHVFLENTNFNDRHQNHERQFQRDGLARI